jgi:tetratricopeptide (TPR) repeat protein
MKKTIFLIICIGLFYGTKAQKVYEFNSVCQQAYHSILQLRLKDGEALIAKARQQNPNNLIPLLLESYIDFFTLFLNEDPALYKVRKPALDHRLELLKEGPQSSPFYDYCLSEVYLHKAVIEMKFSEMWSAAWDIRRAYQHIKDNRKNFPAFSPGAFMYGCLQAVTGTIPNGYKWLTNLLGLKGSLSAGMRTVHEFAYGNDPWAKLMSNESAFVYCYLIYYLENKKDAALQFIKDKHLDLVNNHLLAYMAANLAKNNQETELAKTIILNRNLSDAYFVTPVWDFEMGFIKLHHLEIQEAILYFNRFISNFKGKFYVKDVYQKLSWCYYLEGNRSAADNARINVLKRGSTDADADKQALREAKSGRWPDPLLLKARMLNDGGYNNEALSLLKNKTFNNFSKVEEKLELAYRLARVYDDLGKDKEAIPYYLQAIQWGESRPEYYAHRAALQLGMMYEKIGEKSKAIAYYEKCLTITDNEYKNSLDQKARSGIARCKGE